MNNNVWSIIRRRQNLHVDTDIFYTRTIQQGYLTNLHYTRRRRLGGCITTCSGLKNDANYKNTRHNYIFIEWLHNVLNNLDIQTVIISNKVPLCSVTLNFRKLLISMLKRCLLDLIIGHRVEVFKLTLSFSRSLNSLIFATVSVRLSLFAPLPCTQRYLRACPAVKRFSGFRISIRLIKSCNIQPRSRDKTSGIDVPSNYSQHIWNMVLVVLKKNVPSTIDWKEILWNNHENKASTINCIGHTIRNNTLEHRKD